MDQFSGEIAVLKKYLRSKRVPADAIEELDSLCKDTESRWKVASKRISELLEDS